MGGAAEGCLFPPGAGFAPAEGFGWLAGAAGVALAGAAAALAGGEVCGGGALVQGETPFTGFAAFLVSFWTWLSRTRQLAAGAFVFCTREAFEASGGFDESVYAGEEVWFAIRLKQWGKPRGQRFLLIEDPPVRTSSRKAA